MKNRLFMLDKISVGIAVLNIISVFISLVSFGMLYNGSILYTIVSANGLYVVLGMPITLLLGITLNIISLIKRFKVKSSVSIGIVLFIIYILLILVWGYFFWHALMGV